MLEMLFIWERNDTEVKPCVTIAHVHRGACELPYLLRHSGGVQIQSTGAEVSELAFNLRIQKIDGWQIQVGTVELLLDLRRVLVEGRLLLSCCRFYYYKFGFYVFLHSTHFRYIEIVIEVYELIQVQRCPHRLVLLTVSVNSDIKSNNLEPIINHKRDESPCLYCSILLYIRVNFRDAEVACES